MSIVSDENKKAKAGGRLQSLDAFRGITIAGMILVNNPGTWSAIYPPLAHAEWHGWTPTDLIFPFFLFIVGVAITLAFARRVENGGSQRDLFLNVIRRTLIIFALGLLLNGFPYFNLSEIRIPGVLQRIAVCYFVASIIFLKTNWRSQAIISAALLVLYWMMMTLVPVPGYGAGDLSKPGNLAAYLDRMLLADHIYKPEYDPEGILSTIPAIVTTLLGILTGHWIRSRRQPLEKVTGMFIAGVAGIVGGYVWSAVFPINKALWTSSYVLFTAGMALQLLAVCYWLIDIKNYRRWALPFIIFGVNAITVFVLSGILSRILNLWKVSGSDGSPVPIKTLLYDHLFTSWASPVNASLFWAITYVLIWLGLMSILYRRKIFIKV